MKFKLDYVKNDQSVKFKSFAINEEITEFYSSLRKGWVGWSVGNSVLGFKRPRRNYSIYL